MADPLPLVSVVVPTYNRPDLLLETLATVFAQTFDDHEVVVVNDGSTDDTLARLAPLQQRRGDRLRVVTQPNAGIGAARNRGLDEARGRYVALLDHDDLWRPDKLATQVDFMKTHPQCAACGTVFALSTAPDVPHFAAADVTDADGIVRRPFWHTVHGRDLFQTSTLMIDRDRCRGLRYATDRGAIEDVSFHIGLMARGAYGIAGDRALAVYRVFEGNASKAPQFYYGGIKQLRRLARAGTFDALPPDQHADALLWLGHIGRLAALKQIELGRRWRGLELYLREWPAQLRQRRLRFLLTYPALLLIPAGWMNRLLGRNRTRNERRPVS